MEMQYLHWFMHAKIQVKVGYSFVLDILSMNF